MSLAQSRMTSEQYERWTAPFRGHPGAARALFIVGEILKWVFYLAYPLLLVLLVVLRRDWAGAACLLAVSAAAFALVSIVRARINAARPYEALSIDPLIRKDTRGKSLPSRHVFSCFTIATCWLYLSVPAAACLYVACVAIAFTRVVGGVHFPRDVVVGALVGIASGALAVWLAGLASAA